MRETFVDRYCAALPGTSRRLPFGEETVIWTVHGHMFAAYLMGGQGLSVRRTAQRLPAQEISAQRRVAADPRIADGGWVLVQWSAGPDALRAGLDESFRLVLADGNAVAGA